MEIKIPFYNILNMFLTGMVFIGGCVIIFPEDISGDGRASCRERV